MSKKYYKLSAELIRSGLSTRAQIVYAVLADRQELSNKHDEFKDKDGRYIIFPVSDICDLLGVGERTIKYAFAELEDAGYIRTRKQGKGLPQKIYVCDVQKTARQEVQKTASLINNTDSSNTDIASSSGSSGGAGTGRGLVRLIAMIDSVAAESQIVLTDDHVYKLLKKVRKQGDKIGNLRAWLRSAVTNLSCLPATNEDDGYSPTYDLDAYEASGLPDD